MAIRSNIARVLLALAAATAMAWVVAVFPVFRLEIAVNDVAGGIIAGRLFSPNVLAVVESLTGPNSRLMHRSSMLSKAAIIRLRLAENAIHSGNSELTEQTLKSLRRVVDQALRSAPNDSYLWFVLFSLDKYRNNGVRPDNLRFLRMSYELGPNEGWIILERNSIVLPYYWALPYDLRERATSEFVALVRWGLVEQAADIAAGPALALRSVLFPELKELSDEQRHAFAGAIYGRELDDVPVPGIAPPVPHIPLPALPPNF